MHVVALNWRDLKNPRAGGAETHLEEILRYLARRGHRCTLLTSRFRGGPRDEEVDGYRIVRGVKRTTSNSSCRSSSAGWRPRILPTSYSPPSNSSPSSA